MTTNDDVECMPSILKQAIMIMAISGGTLLDSQLAAALDVPPRVAKAVIEELVARGFVTGRTEAEPQQSIIVPVQQQ